MMSEVNITVETPEPESPAGIAEVPAISSETGSVAIPAADLDETPLEAEIAEQLEEVEQWRSEVNSNLLQTREMVTAQGQTLTSLSEMLGQLSGSVATLLTLAAPPPPSVEEDAPLEAEPENPQPPENPEVVEPEAQPEPQPPPPRKTGRQWM